MRHIGLLHDNDAVPPLGDVYTRPPLLGGLTPFGADVIRECNRLGILVDLAHATAETTAAALKVARKPVIISHTGLDTQVGQNPLTARAFMPRLISKEQARAVADAGGVVGVWTHIADTPVEYAQNVRALVDVIGIDHVCIGTDTKLTPSSPRRAAPGPGAAPARGQDGNVPPAPAAGANGRPAAVPGLVGNVARGRIGERTNEAWQGQTVGFYYAVVDAMLKVGFHADEIEKVGGGNFSRIFGANMR